MKKQKDKMKGRLIAIVVSVSTLFCTFFWMLNFDYVNIFFSGFYFFLLIFILLNLYLCRLILWEYDLFLQTREDFKNHLFKKLRKYIAKTASLVFFSGLLLLIPSAIFLDVRISIQMLPLLFMFYFLGGVFCYIYLYLRLFLQKIFRSFFQEKTEKLLTFLYKKIREILFVLLSITVLFLALIYVDYQSHGKRLHISSSRSFYFFWQNEAVRKNDITLCDILRDETKSDLKRCYTNFFEKNYFLDSTKTLDGLICNKVKYKNSCLGSMEYAQWESLKKAIYTKRKKINKKGQFMELIHDNERTFFTFEMINHYKKENIDLKSSFLEDRNSKNEGEIESEKFRFAISVENLKEWGIDNFINHIDKEIVPQLRKKDAF